jgi:predicted nucleic-acid-binding protein
MIKKIRKYSKNRKIGKTTCEMVLGEEKNVFEFWKFYKNNQENIELVYDVLLLQFCDHNDFQKENLQFYKQGLRDFYNFFIQCYTELENKKEEKELEAKLKKEEENEIIMP